MGRGDVLWADLGNRLGSEPGSRRPVLVIQSDPYNASRLASVVVLPLSSDTGMRRLPGCVLLAADETGLPKDAVANATQVRAIHRERLNGRVGHLADAIMASVDDALQSALGL
jgi:mRNA interferase MazF